MKTHLQTLYASPEVSVIDILNQGCIVSSGNVDGGSNGASDGDVLMMSVFDGGNN